MYFKPYKERQLVLGQEVEVYRNLHTPNAEGFSIRCAETGLVLAHCTNVLLKDAEFIVSEDSRKRVVREQRKNVHAFVRGQLVDFNQVKPDNFKQLYYNPYKTKTFIDSDTQQPIHNADVVFIEGKYSYIKETIDCKALQETKLAI